MTSPIIVSTNPEPSTLLVRKELPPELWKIVLTYLQATSNLRHLTAMASLSKGFLRLCLTSCTMPLSVVGLPFISKCSFKNLEIAKSPQERHNKQRLLAVDEQGRQYSCSQWLKYKHILNIMNLSTLRMTTLDLKTEILKTGIDSNFQKDKGGETLPYSLGQQIVSCYPTQEGFIVVSQAGCSVWKWDAQGNPSLDRFVSPFKDYRGCHTQIRYSAFDGGWIFIQETKYSTAIQGLNLNDPEAKFSQVKISEEITDSRGTDLFLHQIEGKPCLMCDPHSSFLNFKLIQNETDFLLEEESYQVIDVKNFDQPPCSSPHWTLFFASNWSFECGVYTLDKTKNASCLIVHHKGSVWMGPEFDLRMPIEEDNERYLIYNDYLFLSYNDGSFRLVHLPSKSTCPCSNNKILKQFLAQNEMGLYWMSISASTVDRPILKLVFQESSGSLSEVEIPFYPDPSSSPIKSGEPEEDKTSKEAPKSQQPLKLTQKVLPSEYSPQDKLISGIVLFILAWVGTSIALIVLHPGMVVYEGNGVILTLPAVLTLSIGGFAALISIAVGSYRWWKEKSAVS